MKGTDGMVIGIASGKGGSAINAVERLKAGYLENAGKLRGKKYCWT